MRTSKKPPEFEVTKRTYLHPATGRPISRRQYEKLRHGGKTIEQRAKERRAAGRPLRQKKTRVGVIERAKRAIRAILRGVLPTKATKKFKTSLPTIRRRLEATARRFKRDDSRRLRIEREKVLKIPVPSARGYKQISLAHWQSKYDAGVYKVLFDEWRSAVVDGRQVRAEQKLSRFNWLYPNGVTVKTVGGKLVRLPDFPTYLATTEAWERDHSEAIDRHFYIPKLAA